METKGKVGILGGKGNLHLQERLFQYLKGGSTHPGIILTGPEPKLNLEIARGVAKYYFCQNRPKDGSSAFCGTCRSCHRIEEANHPDVLILTEPEEEHIKIDSIRDLCHQMEISPVEGDQKMGIVQDCHRMNVASANAFLKTLEEPLPGRSFWLLTTNEGALLPTITSRCLQFKLSPESEEVGTSEVFEKPWKDFLRNADVPQLLESIADKPAALLFLQFLQQRTRASVVGDPAGLGLGSDLELVELYDEVLTLESRLRSNANYALMLESFLRRHFIEANP